MYVMKQTRHICACSLFLSLFLLLSPLLTPVYAVEEPTDPRIRGLNQEFYHAFTQLLSTRDTSRYFGSIQLYLGQPHMLVDGVDIPLEAAPELSGDRTMLPIRAVAEAAGAVVLWEQETRSVVIRDGYGVEVRSSIGSRDLSINGEIIHMDAVPYLKDGSSFFPIRAICEALNLEVSWDSRSAGIILTAPYQTARVLVMTRAPLEQTVPDAKTILNDGTGLQILQFASPTEARDATELLIRSGYLAEPDLWFPHAVDSVSDTSDDSAQSRSWGVTDCGFDHFLAENASRFGESPVVVAVVDTGVDASHPDLSGRVTVGWNFAALGDGDSRTADTDAHGTRVASVILDCVGDAPVEILPVRVLEHDESVCASQLKVGIEYAANRRADIINLSLGGPLLSENFDHSAIDMAIRYAVSKGSVVIVSAGNDGEDTQFYCPAHDTTGGVIVVAAADRARQLLPNSNFGESVDLMAPGTEVFSAVPGGGRSGAGGSSLAAPHVSAAAALLDLATDKTLPPAELETLVCSAAGTRSRDGQTDFGFLDLRQVQLPPVSVAEAPKNVLRSDRMIVSKAESAFDAPAFGTPLKRRDISAITFLDTMARAPADAWDVSEAGDGSVYAWAERNNALYTLYIAGNGGVSAPEDCSLLFGDYPQLEYVRFGNAFHTTQARDMSGMFENCFHLKALDLSGFDTSGVTDMSYLFYGCAALSQLNLSSFSTANVTNMLAMFYSCGALEQLDISSFDTARVTDMSNLFRGCAKLTTLDVSGFDTSRARNMSAMFAHCLKLRALDVSGFNTAVVENFSGMFDSCMELTELDVSGFHTAACVSFGGMFHGCVNLKTLDVSGFDTRRAVSMLGMFERCQSLESLDVSGFETPKLQEMYGMFRYCSALRRLDLRGFQTDQVTAMNELFAFCDSLQEVNVSSFDTGAVRTMNAMFGTCPSLERVDVSGFDTSNVRDMAFLFNECSTLRALDVSAFDTSLVMDFSAMFQNCAALTSLDVSGFDTSNGLTFLSMFQGCSGVQTLDVSGFDTSSARTMENMFALCSRVKTLDVSGFDTSRVTSMRAMFGNCGALRSLDVSGFQTSLVTSFAVMFQNCASLTSLDVSGFDTRQATDMSFMFMGCSGLRELDISGFSFAKARDISYMFAGCTGLSTPPNPGTWDLSAIPSHEHYLP